jgi:MoaA/NifB/PqqE/SkfB family radical SAM enzyme
MLDKFPYFNKTKIIPQPNVCFVYSKEQNVFDVFNHEALAYFQYMNGEQSGKSILRKITEDFPMTDLETIQTDYEQLLNYLLQRKYASLQDKVCKSDLNFPFEFVNEANQVKSVHADIELTRNCNLSCFYCYAGSHRNKKYDDLPIDKWIDILNTLHNQGLRAVKISGGEPFLYSNIKEFCEFCSEKFIVSINTNGCFISEKEAKWLSQLNIQVIQVSLDSLTNELHDKVRGKGSWEKAFNAINLLHNNDIPIRLSCTITQQNKQEIAKLQELATSFNAEINFDVMKPVGRAKKAKDSLFVADSCEVIYQKTVPQIYQLLDFLEIKCQAQLGFIGISSKGNAKPCNLTEDFFEELGIPVVNKINSDFSYPASTTFRLTDSACKEVIAAVPKEGGKSYDKCVFYHKKK